MFSSPKSLFSPVPCTPNFHATFSLYDILIIHSLTSVQHLHQRTNPLSRSQHRHASQLRDSTLIHDSVLPTLISARPYERAASSDQRQDQQLMNFLVLTTEPLTAPSSPRPTLLRFITYRPLMKARSDRDWSHHGGNQVQNSRCVGHYCLSR